MYPDQDTIAQLLPARSWSHTPDQIEMCPDRDTIAQLLPARHLCLFDFAT